MTYEPLASDDGKSIPRQSGLSAHISWLREKGTNFHRSFGALLRRSDFWSTLGFFVGFLLIGAFVCFWAYVFFGGIWSAITYDAEAANKKALAMEAEKNAALIKPVMDKLAKLESDIGLLRQAVDRLGAGAGRRREL